MPPTVRQQKPIQSESQPILVDASSRGILTRIAPVHLNQKKDTINIFGMSGSGKTTLACTWPKPVLLIGAEDGTRSVADMKGVDFVRLKESMEIAELFNHVKAGGRARCMPAAYQTLVIDTITSLQAMTMKEILGLKDI